MSVALENRLRALFQRPVDARGFATGPGFSVGTIKGPVREENQDRAFVAHIVEGGSKPKELLVAVVLDGMGGMHEGGEAAGIAASSFLAALVRIPGPVAFRLEAGIQAANSAVFGKFAGRGGTTLTAVAFAEPRVAYAIHVGDSRLYRTSRSSEITLVTEDQTVGSAIRDKKGTLDEDELDNRLLQFVGIGADMAPSHFKFADPDFSTWLLTTDGAHSLGRKALHGVLRPQSPTESVVRRLLTAADNLGSDDNATAIAICPAQYRVEGPFFEGTTLRVWTPDKSLEIWLPEIAPKPLNPGGDHAANFVAHGLEEPKATEPKLPAKKSKTTKPRKKQREPKEAETSLRAGQLIITFGKEDDS